MDANRSLDMIKNDIDNICTELANTVIEKSNLGYIAELLDDLLLSLEILGKHSIDDNINLSDLEKYVDTKNLEMLEYKKHFDEIGEAL